MFELAVPAFKVILLIDANRPSYLSSRGSEICGFENCCVWWFESFFELGSKESIAKLALRSYGAAAPKF